MRSGSPHSPDCACPSFRVAGHGESQQPLLDGSPSEISEYSTTVIRGHSQQATSTVPPSLSSILTIRATPNPEDHSFHNALASIPPAAAHGAEPTASGMTFDSYRTAASSLAPSVAAATEGGSQLRISPSALVHRFTLIKPGARKAATGGGGHSRSTSPHGHAASPSAGGVADGWSPFDFFFSSGMRAAKCDLCTKRIGWKPVLECDDCGLRCARRLV